MFVVAATVVAAAVMASPAPPMALSRLHFACSPPAEAEKFALLELQHASESPEQQATDLAAARSAIAQALELHRKALAGSAVPAPYDNVSVQARLAAEAKDPRLGELHRRVVRDQLPRFDFSVADSRQLWAAGLSDNARQYAYAMVGHDGCDVDQANTAWLKGQLAEIGWFTISRFGKEADSAAWLLVQHADKDRAFQGEVLTKLEALAASGETDRKHYAYLFDRVAVGRGALQRYGTQGRCVAAGVWEPLPVEAPDQLDARRAAVDLPSEATYEATFKDRCHTAELPSRTGKM